MTIPLTNNLYLGADQYQYIIFTKKGSRLVASHHYPRLDQVASFLANKLLKGELSAGGSESQQATQCIDSLLERLSHGLSTLEMALTAAVDANPLREKN